MLQSEACRIISDIVAYDYDSNEECSHEHAEIAITNALRLGYSNVSDSQEAIRTLGRDHAMQVYLDSWVDRHSDEGNADR
jgi:hypothetical protein